MDVLFGLVVGAAVTFLIALPFLSQKKVLRQEIRDLRVDFAHQWAAAQRAIKLWQDAHPGQENKWPDSAKLMVWLMEELDKHR